MKYDYERIFREKKDDANSNIKFKKNKSEIKKIKERRYIIKFFVQSIICLIIIGSIVVAKYVSPNTFVSVTSVLNGLYENNITLSDLNALIDESILKNDALAAFFNFSGE